MFSARRSASSTKAPLVILATSSPELARNRGQLQTLSQPKAPRSGCWSTVPKKNRTRMVPTKPGRAAGKSSNHGNTNRRISRKKTAQSRYLLKKTSDSQSRSRYESTAQLSRKRPRWNRPFYRYGGHIELIRFRKYYRMPRGHEHISFVFSSAFRDIFSQSFLRIRL